MLQIASITTTVPGPWALPHTSGCWRQSKGLGELWSSPCLKSLFLFLFFFLLLR